MMNTKSTPGDHALTLTDKRSHRFFEHLDVVLELCELLCHLRWKKSLLAFGSTCKALFKPAMDVLWRSLDNLIDLLKVIPNLVQDDDQFVCYSISDNGFNLTTEPRQSRACSRIVLCPDSTCTLGESELCLWFVFSQGLT